MAADDVRIAENSRIRAEIIASGRLLALNGESVGGLIVNRSGANPLLWSPGALFQSEACYIGFESHYDIVGTRLHKDDEDLAKWLTLFKAFSDVVPMD